MTREELINENKLIADQLSEIKRTINNKALIDYQEKFLQLTGLKVGSEVMCSFGYNTGNAKQAYHSRGSFLGVIKAGFDGILFVESVDKLNVSRSKSNNRTGRQRKDWWEFDLINVNATLDDIDLTGITPPQNEERTY